MVNIDLGSSTVIVAGCFRGGGKLRFGGGKFTVSATGFWNRIVINAIWLAFSREIMQSERCSTGILPVFSRQCEFLQNKIPCYLYVRLSYNTFVLSTMLKNIELY